ncbi:MAG: BrxE family protein [Acidobacteria bacterium]|nr:BrxE family protein [Acidobacteriota bacterium]
MRSTHLQAIASARFLVGALGERRSWWPARFTDPTSRRSLELLFPRTAVRAALESVVEVARRDHDERLSPRSFHLFRLPVHLEDRLAGWLGQLDERAGLTWPPADLAAVHGELERLGRAAGAVGEPSPGPRCLGKPARLNQGATIHEVVGAYLAADRAGLRVMPYFEE